MRTMYFPIEREDFTALTDQDKFISLGRFRYWFITSEYFLQKFGAWVRLPVSPSKVSLQREAKNTSVEAMNSVVFYTWRKAIPRLDVTFQFPFLSELYVLNDDESIEDIINLDVDKYLVNKLKFSSSSLETPRVLKIGYEAKTVISRISNMLKPKETKTKEEKGASYYCKYQKDKLKYPFLLCSCTSGKLPLLYVADNDLNIRGPFTTVFSAIERQGTLYRLYVQKGKENAACCMVRNTSLYKLVASNGSEIECNKDLLCSTDSNGVCSQWWSTQNVFEAFASSISTTFMNLVSNGVLTGGGLLTDESSRLGGYSVYPDDMHEFDDYINPIDPNKLHKRMLARGRLTFHLVYWLLVEQPESFIVNSGTNEKIVPNIIYLFGYTKSFPAGVLFKLLPTSSIRALNESAESNTQVLELNGSFYVLDYYPTMKGELIEGQVSRYVSTVFSKVPIASALV